MKCNKVKNPCKICFQAVTKKNGLQCQGACRKWAHFKCLNYTPGKIQDIKTGVIKVTCPCPDCNTSEPKEVLVNPPFTCTNTKCPANNLPICESQECLSKDNPIPVYPPPPLDRSDSSQHCLPCPPPRRTSNPKRCPVCPPQHEAPQCPPTPPRCPPPLPKCPPSPPKVPARSRSPPCPNPQQCSPSCKTICPPTCPSHQNVNKKGKRCCSPKQSQSCSNLSDSSSKSVTPELRAASSESQITNSGKGVDQEVLYSAIENLCNTVGHLSSQLKDLMCKMQESR